MTFKHVSCVVLALSLHF